MPAKWSRPVFSFGFYEGKISRAFGRDPAKFGIEGWLRMHSPAPQDWAAAADGWRRLGADMVMLYPMYRISNFDGHIETLRRFKEVASG